MSPIEKATRIKREVVAIEALLHQLWEQVDPVFKFSSLEEELEALTTWKKVSCFPQTASSFTENCDAICMGAARRGLTTTIVPRLDNGSLVEMEMYVCKEAETWRIRALQELTNQFLEAKRGWNDDFERTQARLLGYSAEDTEAWIRQNYQRNGFWTGWLRVFIGFEVGDEAARSMALLREFPASMDGWWVVALPRSWRLRTEFQPPPAAVLRAALREDPMLDAYAEGEEIAFQTLEGARARRVRAAGADLNVRLYAPVDLVSPSGPGQRPQHLP